MHFIKEVFLQILLFFLLFDFFKLEFTEVGKMWSVNLLMEFEWEEQPM